MTSILYVIDVCSKILSKIAKTVDEISIRGCDLYIQIVGTYHKCCIINYREAAEKK